MLRNFFVQLIFFSFFSTGVYGQVSNMAEDVINPSPLVGNTGSFSGEGQQGFTGSAPINIPLYKIKLKELELPINLTYNNSGVRVGSISGWVGTNWNLDVGGVVSRLVNGTPDDIIRNGHFSYSFVSVLDQKDYGYLLGGGQACDSFSDEGKTSNQIYAQLLAVNGSPFTVNDNLQSAPVYKDEVWAHRYDTQPDLFYLNIFGKTNKFVFGADQKARLINYDPIQIDYTIDNSRNPAWGNGTLYGSKGITSFTVKDEKGNVYTFADLDFSLMNVDGNRIRTFCDIDPEAHLFHNHNYYTSAWYLTTIKTYAGEQVNFNYAVNTVYMQGGGRSLMGTSATGVNAQSISTAAHRLTSIETPYEKVLFEANDARSDYKNSFALNYIRVISKFDNRPLNVFQFLYSYFVDLNNSSVHPVKLPPVTNGSYYADAEHMGDHTQHLKLDGINIINPAVDADRLTYRFTYDERYPLPSRYSTAQDFWGYYNGNHQIYSNYIPRIYYNAALQGQDRLSVLLLSSIDYMFDGIDKSANSNFASVGSLTKITYPTGGSTSYEYESNDFIYRGKYFQGGGIRTKKITDYDGLSHSNDIVRTYTYTQSANPETSSGVLFSLPQYAHIENSCAYPTSGVPGSPTTYDQPSDFNKPLAFPAGSANYLQYYTTRTEEPSSTSGIGDQIPVGYSEIKETILNGGYTWYRYAVPGQYGDYNDSVAGGCDLTGFGLCDDLFKPAPVKYTTAYTISNANHGVMGHPDSPPSFGALKFPSQLPNVTGMDLSNNSYPYIPKSNYDWNRGLLLSKKIFNQAGSQQTALSYKYALVNPNVAQNIVNGLTYLTGSNYYIRIQNDLSPLVDRMIIYYNKFKIYTNVNKLPVQEIREDFVNGQTITNKKTFSYTQKKFLREVTQMGSNNDLLKISYRYPFDLAGPIDGPAYYPLSFLVQKNNIYRPVEAVHTLVRGSTATTTGVDVTSFTASSTAMVNLGSRSKLEIDESLSTEPYQQAYADFRDDSEIFVTDHRLTVTDNHSYDDIGNEQQLLVDGKYSSTLWGYKKLYPVANAFNAKYQNIFFENFEEEVGNSQEYKTGLKSFSGAYQKMLTNLDNGNYWLVYWKKNTSGLWDLIRTQVNVANNSYTISISGQIDDVRFYPLGAVMKTYTYEPLVGQSSVTDENGIITFTDYDNFKRVYRIRDHDGNIIRQFCYNSIGNSAGQPTDCTIPIVKPAPIN